MALETISIRELQTFVSVYQPDAVLRDSVGLDVRVGRHFPPLGGPAIVDNLNAIIKDAHRGSDVWKDSYHIHQRYETLHPFTDGNGRSGRMLWLWMIQYAPLGFLHTWYYQSLQEN
jgi:Fic family protein